MLIIYILFNCVGGISVVLVVCVVFVRLLVDLNNLNLLPETSVLKPLRKLPCFKMLNITSNP
jgi:hypothetical protein